jgi:hypothetical protein
MIQWKQKKVQYVLDTTIRKQTQINVNNTWTSLNHPKENLHVYVNAYSMSMEWHSFWKDLII